MKEDAEERITRLAHEKARLQLTAHAMSRIGSEASLDATIQNLLLAFLDTFGGSETALYYLADETVFRADLSGVRVVCDPADGTLVASVFAARERAVREHAFGDTKMLTAPFSAAWDWALPLLCGPDLVGVLEMTDTHIAPSEIEGELLPLLDHSALVLKNRLLEHARAERADRLAAIVESSDDAIIGKSLEGVVTSWNQGAEAVYGYSESEMVGAPISSLVPPGRDDELPAILEKVATGQHIQHYETVRRRKDGELIHVSLAISPIHDANGTVVAASTVARDITTARASEEALRRLNRRLRAVSACNQVLVRAADEQDFSDDVCRIVCDMAGYRMARVDMAEHDEERTLRPIAWAGAGADYHEHIKVSWGTGPTGRGPGGRCIRERRPIVARDIRNDPDFEPWRDEATRRGYKSLIALPLLGRRDEVFGALGIYSDEPDAFDAQETALLAELAGDLGFGIEALRERQARAVAEERASEAARYARSLIEVNLSPLVTISPAGKITDVNAATEEATGVPRDQLIGTDFADYFTEPGEARAGYQRVLEEGLVRDYPLVLRHVSGSLMDVEYNATVYREEAGELLGVFAAARDVTEAKKARAQVARLAAIVTSSQDAIISKDLDGTITSWNAAAELLYGYTAEEMIGRSVTSLMPPGREGESQELTECVLRGELVSGHETQRKRKDGSLVDVALTMSPIRDAAGNVVTVSIIGHDITERRLAEEAQRHLNRELRAVSDCNQALMRAEDEQTLLDDVCRIVCDEAGYPMTWVGFADDDDAKTIRPVAWAGVENGYIAEAGMTWADTERGRGPSGTAIRTGRTGIIQDFATDRQAAPWRELAAQHGYRSSIGLSLKDGSGRAFGVLNIYSAEPNAFSADETRLLEELAGDLAFGITALRDRAERKQAEEALRASQRKLSLHLEQTLLGVIEWDTDFRAREWNPAAEAIFGYGREEAIGRDAAELILPEAVQPEVDSVFERLLQQEGGQFHTNDNVTKDGRIIRCEWINTPLVDESGNVTGIMALARDVTERELAARELQQSEEKFSAAFHASPDLMAVTRMSDGTILEVNEAFTQLLGFTRAESLGRKTTELFIWGDPADRATFIAALAESGQVTEFETTVRRKDGSLVNCIDSARAIDFGGESCVLSVVHDITQRKQVEEERLARVRLVESMDRVNRAIQGTNDLQHMMSDVLSIVLSSLECDRAWLFYPCDPVSPTFRVPMEVTRPEYPGAGVSDIDVPMPPDMAENLREALESVDPVTYLVGTDRPINKVSAEQFGVQSQMLVALYPKTGKPWAFGVHQCSHPRVWTAEEAGLLQEIGRRLTDALTSLLSQRDVQESEAKYRRIVDVAAEGIWVLGPDDLTTFTNTRMAAMLGFSGEAMIGRPVTDFMFGEDAADHAARMENHRRGLSDNYERRFRRKDGETIWTRVSAVPIFDDEQQFDGIMAMFTDITARRQAEEALRQSEERYRRLAENARDVIYRMSLPDGRYEYASPAALQMFGYSPEELYETPALFREAIHPDWRAYFEEQWADLLKGEVPPTYEYQFVHKSGEIRWLNQRNILVRDDSGDPIALEGIVTDITERKLAEQEILLLNAQLEQRVAERTRDLESANRELEAFSYSVSHDLRTPLRALDGFSQALLEDCGDALDVTGAAYLARIRRAAQHMGELIDALLDLSRVARRELTPEEVDLSALARGITGQLQAVEPQRRVEVVVADGLVVRADPALLEVVLGNLLGNAWKFTGKKAEARIEVGTVRADGETAYFVRDDGAGFDPTYASTLFEPFRRLHGEAEFAGTGIGLATVQRVISRHGGRCWAEGQVDKGATFYFTLPGAEGGDSGIAT